MSDDKFSFETPENDRRVALARAKLCAGGCLKTWDEAGGGWMEFATGSTLQTFWRCNECSAKHVATQGTAIANPPGEYQDPGPKRAAEAKAHLLKLEKGKTEDLASEKSHSSEGDPS